MAPGLDLSAIVTNTDLRAGLTHGMQRPSARGATLRSSARPARAWSVP
ncbi:hypothetical protein [Sorangium sp. So ce426]